MKLLITGHKGFIGGNLLSHLSEAGYEVNGFDVGDEFPQARYDVIFHLAARGLIRKSVGLPYAYFKDDLDLSLQFLEKARVDGSGFVFPSSGATAMPSNPYALSKKQTVEWINLYRHLYNVQAYDLKFFNIYGPGSRKGGVYLFTKMALSGGPIEILGDGEDIRDFVFVNDVVEFLTAIAESRVKPGSYEVGTGVGTSIQQLADKIAEIVGGRPAIVMKPDVIETARRLVASSPALVNPVLLEDGIRRVIDFIKSDESTGRVSSRGAV